MLCKEVHRRTPSTPRAARTSARRGRGTEISQKNSSRATRESGSEILYDFPRSLQSFLSFFSFISLIADGPHHYHPACGHKGSSHLSPVHALHFFYRDASSALLQLVNQWLNFTYSRSHAFRYERKNTNPTGKNRTHDFRTSRCAAYLLDHSGDETANVYVYFRKYDFPRSLQNLGPLLAAIKKPSFSTSKTSKN